MLKPNVIVIMADQLRYDYAGADAPNISALKNESVSFEQAYSSCPLCIPARGSFFTGRYPNETGCIINPFDEDDRQYGYVSEDCVNWYDYLAEEYDVWHVGKQHFYTEDHIDKKPDTRVHWTHTQPDYRAYLKEKGVAEPGGMHYRGILPQMNQDRITHVTAYSAPVTGKYEGGFDNYYDGYFLKGALDAIRNRDPEKPFCLMGMFLAPHPPLHIPDPWYSMYQDSADHLPENVGRWCKDQSPLQMYNITGVLGSRRTREEWANVWNVYRGLVTLLDECVGQIVRELKEQGIYENSVIIFTSDHGEMLGSHSLWQKMCMYQEAVRTPLYMKMPGQHAGKICEALTGTMDVFPTVCEVLGLPIPNSVTGKSLKEALDHENIARQHRKQLCIQFDGNGGLGNRQRCIIRDQKKMIADTFKGEIYLELYDLEHDPMEMKNLAFEAEYQETCMQLLALLRTHMKETGDSLEIPETVYEDFLQMYQGHRIKDDFVLC